MNGQGGLRIISRPLLAELTSIRLGGPAVACISVSDKRGVERAAARLSGFGGRPALIGRGSNILAGDGELPLALLNLESGEEPKAVAEEDGRILLRVHGGLKLSSLLSRAAALGLTGLAGLAGIPGSVGGAVAMNAGSFGAEIGAFVREVEIFSPAAGFVTLTARDMEFAYRSCRFLPLARAGVPTDERAGVPADEHDARAAAERERADWVLICSATLALEKGDPDRIRAAMREVLRKKRQSQPLEAWSAGSAFKNPAPDAPAGLLLERAGLKGKVVGGMCFSEKHANFLVNLGGGTFAQAMELVHLAKERVKAQSGHELELEVRLWP